MCKWMSMLVDREGKVHHDGNTASHEELVTKANLKDDKLENRDFVRIEISPKNFSAEKEDWAFKVDEEGTLPAWYLEGKGIRLAIIKDRFVDNPEIKERIEANRKKLFELHTSFKDTGAFFSCSFNGCQARTSVLGWRKANYICPSCSHDHVQEITLKQVEL